MKKTSMTERDIRIEEEENKESVYNKLHSNLEKAENEYSKKKSRLDWGEAQDNFFNHTIANEAKRERDEAKSLYEALYDEPYFAHLAIKEVDKKYAEAHYFLSSCDSLDSIVDIDDDHTLVPFMQSDDKPMLTELLKCYQSRSTDSFVVPLYRNGVGHEEKCSFKLTLHRDVTINKRRLSEIRQWIPSKVDTTSITSDEFLYEKLSKNRKDPKLSNIIATLQEKQFEIIQSDIALDFVVQGCAGSGKSQCLIHRLFYFRAKLRDDGWGKVLLITPTKLFRAYSSKLMHRYRLTDVNNTSIAELYKNLLLCYDDRFKNRQYIYEFSEEYLPDEYLRTVYSADNIEKINNEIKVAIKNRVDKGCDLAGISRFEKITIDDVNDLITALDKVIVRFDAEEQKLLENREYVFRRDEREKLEKELTNIQRENERLNKRKEILNLQKAEFDDLYTSYKKVRSEYDELTAEKLRVIREQKKIFNARAKALNRAKTIGESLKTAAEYTEMLFEIESSRNMKQGEIRHFEYVAGCLEDESNRIKSFTKNRRPETWLEAWEKSAGENRQQIITIKERSNQISAELQAHNEWLRKNANEKKNIKRKAYREELDRVRYYLVRLESSVFEQDVWSKLEPIKKSYNVETVHIEKLKDGHQKQTRILYKSDMLFYLKIYTELHSNKNLPEFKLICIDEAQDLHKADYDMLHAIYPDATLNVFGDTKQALHEECGILDWKKDTGINTVFELNTNYRNEAAIVKFCNDRFDGNMKYYEAVRTEYMPNVINDAHILADIIKKDTAAVIVKDREAFKALCVATGLNEDEFEYLDTRSDMPSDKKISCYSIYAAKGIEFAKAVVFADNMNSNQKLVACTRATKSLIFYESR